jgi:uncharacterized YccA/Bax inhibitor family protein
VLARLGQAARLERPSGAGYGVYPQAAPTRMMTLDDVVVRTVALLLLTGVTGAASWAFLHSGPLVALALIGSVIAGLALVLVISFMRVTNPLVIAAYAVTQGVLLGVVSRAYEQRFSGIVLQAVFGTFAVFLVMAGLYKFRVLRATPKFTRFVIGALIGIVALTFLNLIFAAFHVNLGLIDYNIQGQGRVGLLPILFSLAAVAIGALTFILDFDQVEQGIRYGLPERYAWYCAFGLLVGLIFLYWQLLRLLGYARR